MKSHKDSNSTRPETAACSQPSLCFAGILGSVASDLAPLVHSQQSPEAIWSEGKQRETPKD